jgi:hypothetical protein
MILFSEIQINQVINNTDINAGYAIEGSFSFSENGETVVGLYFNSLKDPSKIDGLRLYSLDQGRLTEINNGSSPVIQVGFQKGPAVVADLNGDGLVDILNVDHGKEVEGTQVDGNWPGGVNHLILSAFSNPNVSDVPIMTTEQRFWHDLDAGDVDNDGDLDIVMTSFDAIYLFTNNGSGEFSTQILDRFSDHGVVQFIDVDSDGFSEILTAPYINGQQKQLKLFSSENGIWSGRPIGPINPFGEYGAFESQEIQTKGSEKLIWVSTEVGIGPARNFIVKIDDSEDISVAEIVSNSSLETRDIYVSDFNFDGLNDIFLSTNGTGPLGERFFFDDGQGNFSQSLEFMSIFPQSTFAKTMFPLLETKTSNSINLLANTGSPPDFFSSLITITLDSIEGAISDDQLLGDDKDNIFIAGLGNDTLNGGDGTDIAIFSGVPSEYSVQETGKDLIITDNQADRDGVDSLFSIETLQFSDGVAQLTDLVRPEDIDRGIYRFFNVDTGTHFLSGSTVERDSVINNLDSFNFEGPTFRAADPTNAAADTVFRFFNTQTGTHFFTQSTVERDNILDTIPQFNFEGEAYKGYTEQVDGSIPLYRFFNTQTGTHFYTAAEAEKDSIVANLPSFNFEGTAYWVDPVMG